MHQKFVIFETEEYSEPSQAPNMLRFAEIVNGFKSGISFKESSVSDVSLGFEGMSYVRYFFFSFLKNFFLDILKITVLRNTEN